MPLNAVVISAELAFRASALPLPTAPLEAEQLITCARPDQIALHYLEDRAFFTDLLRSRGALLILAGRTDPQSLAELQRTHPANRQVFTLESSRLNRELIYSSIHQPLIPMTAAICPTPGWARQVFPELPEPEAQNPSGSTAESSSRGSRSTFTPAKSWASTPRAVPKPSAARSRPAKARATSVNSPSSGKTHPSPVAARPSATCCSTKNAAAHVALGQGFPSALGRETSSPSQLEAAGCNRSAVHADIPFGSAEVTIVATGTSEGEVVLLENGLWAERFDAA